MKEREVVLRLGTLIFVAGMWLAAIAVAEAHDCSSPKDCEQTGGYNGALATAGGLIAIGTAIIGSTLLGNGGAGGGLGGAAGGGSSAGGNGGSGGGSGAIPPAPVGGTVIDTRVVGGPEAIQEIINNGGTLITTPEGTFLVPPENFPPGFHGGGWDSVEITDPTTGRTINAIPPGGEAAVVIDWPHPSGPPVDSWVDPNSLIGRGFPTVNIGGTTYVQPPENLPPNMAGGAWGTTDIPDPNHPGETITVINPNEPTWVSEWPPGSAPPPPPPPSLPPSVPVSLPDSVPVSLPDSVPVSLPDTVPVSLPESVPVSLPESVPVSVPQSVPVSVPESVPVSVPESVPASLPESVPASVPESVPASVPESVPASVPESVPASVPESVPASLPDSAPASVPASPPASVPESPPASVPESVPASPPASLPASVPPSVPASAPAVAASVPAGPTLDGMKTALADSPTGRDAIKWIEDNRIPVVIGRPGGGSTWDGTQITLDPNESNEEAALTIVHEVNHGISDRAGASGNAATQNRNDYRNTMIAEEVKGTVKSIEAKNELVAAGGHPSATFPLEAEYNQAYQNAANAFRTANPGATPAQIDAAGKTAGTAAVDQGFRNGGVVTSNTGESYLDYYGKAWDNAHPAGAGP